MRKIKNVGPVLLLMLILGACASMPPIFQTDPVGASLYAMKNGYEGTVRSVGQAYMAGQITREQLKDFVDKARDFYTAYLLTVNLYEAKQLTDPQTQIKALRDALDELQLSLQSMLLKKKTPTVPSDPELTIG